MSAATWCERWGCPRSPATTTSPLRTSPRTSPGSTRQRAPRAPLTARPRAPGWFNPVAAAAVEWTREQLTEENARFLRGLSRMMQKEGALFVHGSIRDPDEYIINTASANDNLAILKQQYPNVRVCFFGHTHVKAVAPSPNGPMNGGPTLALRSGGPHPAHPGPVGTARARAA